LLLQSNSNYDYLWNWRLKCFTWNQTFTWASDKLRADAKYNLSGPTIYCCLSNSISSFSSCSGVKMVLTLFDFPWEILFCPNLWHISILPIVLLGLISDPSTQSILLLLLLFICELMTFDGRILFFGLWLYRIKFCSAIYAKISDFSSLLISLWF
jgi:hypothetical protein